MERLLGLKTKDKIAWHNRNKSLRREDSLQSYSILDKENEEAQRIFGYLKPLREERMTLLDNKSFNSTMQAWLREGHRRDQE